MADTALKGSFTTPELARYTGKPVSFFERARLDGSGPPFRYLGASVLYLRTDVDAWLSALPAFANTSAAPAVRRRRGGPGRPRRQKEVA
jgi:hypothetical protein